MSLSLEEAKTQIDKLTKTINHHNELYYTKDSPEIEDYEYDMLFRELEGLENDYPNLKQTDSPTLRVGFNTLEKFEKFEHPIAMYSLSNVMNEAEFFDFHNRMIKELNTTDIKYTTENKFDGLALELIYENGSLIVASTRGDGNIGENVTNNVLVINNIPKKIKETKKLIVRGEVLITKKDFNILNQERIENEEALFANPRNAASGGLRQLDNRESKKRRLKFFAYQIANYNDFSISTEANIMSFLKSLGFTVEGVTENIDSDEVIKKYNEISIARQNLDYEIDGLVIKIDRVDYQEKLGFLSRAPRFACAFKFKPAESQSILKSIEIQVGRTGALTPVAKVEPVYVAGVMVSSVTLHNPQEIISKDIRIGDTVMIIRSGDVIPKITRVIKEKRPSDSIAFQFPTKCPACGGETAITDGDIIVRCINDECPIKITRYIEYFVSKPAMNMEGLGKEWINTFTSSGLVKEPADVYKITASDLEKYDRMGEKLSDKMLSSIEKSKNPSLKKFIYSLGIRQVGENTSDILANYFKSIDNFINLKKDDLMSLENIGDISANSIYEFVKNEKTRSIILNLLEVGVIPIYEAKTIIESAITGKNVVITGSIEGYSRSSAKDMAQKLGANVHSSVGKSTDILIVGEGGGGKIKKAEELGVSIMTGEEFKALL